MMLLFMNLKMTIAQRIIRIKNHIQKLEAELHRPSGSVTLLAVSKGHSSESIRQAQAAGLNEFGENYWQEAQKKISDLRDLPIRWHFIGAIQSNKTAEIAASVDWVHSVDREKTARLLSMHRPASMPPLKICIQVKLDQEASKSGITPEELEPLARLITELPHLKLCGLMAIPRPRENETEQYRSFLRLSQLLDKLNQQTGLKLNTLSMGMSDDMDAAIKAGSTMIRIGRAIFGERQ